MLERDLAYRRRSSVNWCPSCQTVLANEQVIDGACWRCGTTVTTRELEQWFFRITHYADELLDATNTLTEWPEKVLTMQQNWIGRSEGARVRFALAQAGMRDAGSGVPGSGRVTIEVFTTRIDTIYGATFVMLAPEHGLVNVFAKELDVPTRLENAWQTILAGHETLIDLPFANFCANGFAQKRYFAQMAGAGLDSRAVAMVDWELKKRIGALAYVVACFKALRGKMPQVMVSDGTQSISAEMVLIGNGRFYGGRYEAFPMADLRDAMLEVSIWPKVDIPSAIRSSWGLLTNKLYSTGGVRHFKAAKITISATDPVPFHLDGEDAGMLPVEFSVEPRALRVIVP